MMRRLLRKRILPSMLMAIAASFAATPVLADGAAQVSLLKTLLPLFVAVAIPIFVIVAALHKDGKAAFKGIVVGIIAFVIISVLVGLV